MPYKNIEIVTAERARDLFIASWLIYKHEKASRFHTRETRQRIRSLSKKWRKLFSICLWIVVIQKMYPGRYQAHNVRVWKIARWYFLKRSALYIQLQLETEKFDDENGWHSVQPST